MNSSDSDAVNYAIDSPFSGTQFFDKILENEEYLAKYHEYLRILSKEYVQGGMGGGHDNGGGRKQFEAQSQGNGASESTAVSGNSESSGTAAEDTVALSETVLPADDSTRNASGAPDGQQPPEMPGGADFNSGNTNGTPPEKPSGGNNGGFPGGGFPGNDSGSGSSDGGNSGLIQLLVSAGAAAAGLIFAALFRRRIR